VRLHHVHFLLQKRVAEGRKLRKSLSHQSPGKVSTTISSIGEDWSETKPRLKEKDPRISLDLELKAQWERGEKRLMTGRPSQKVPYQEKESRRKRVVHQRLSFRHSRRTPSCRKEGRESQLAYRGSPAFGRGDEKQKKNLGNFPGEQKIKEERRTSERRVCLQPRGEISPPLQFLGRRGVSLSSSI